MKRHRLTFLPLTLAFALLIGVGARFYVNAGQNPDLSGADVPDGGGWAVAALLLSLFAASAIALIRSRQRQRATEKRFKVYFDHAMVGMATTSLDKRWLVVNPALCRILGYSAAELQQKTWTELTHPDDLAANLASFQKVVAGQSDGYEMEKRFVRKDGRVIDTAIATRPIRRADGSVDCFIVNVEDITERRRAEADRRASEERLRLLGDNLPDSYVYQYTHRDDGSPQFLYISSGVSRVHAVTPETVLADAGAMLDLVDPSQLPTLLEAIAVSQRDLTDFSIDLRARLANEAWGWLRLRSRPQAQADGRVVWHGVASDVSAEHRNDDLLNLQARRANALLALPRMEDQLNEREFMRYALDLAENLTGSQIAFMHFVNDDNESVELAAWSGRTLTEYCSANFDSHYPLSQAGLWADAVRQKRPLVINDYHGAAGKRGLPPGHSTLIRLISVPVIEADHVRMVTGVGNKGEDYGETDIETVQLISNESWRIVRKRRAEQALRLATQVVTASPVVCFRWLASPGRPTLFVSDNVTQWGYTPPKLLAGQPPFDQLVHPEDLPRVVAEVDRHTAAGLTNWEQEYRLLTAEGNPLWVSDRTSVVRNPDGAIAYFDAVLTDISERKTQEQALVANLAAQKVLNKRLEEAHNQLLQAEKMASIGQLAAGIAHELNNPIGFVHSNLGTLDGYLHDLIDIVDTYDKHCSAPRDVVQIRAAVAQLKEERDFAFVREDIFNLLAESKDGLTRVRKIVQDLKGFSRVGEQEWQWSDLHQGLDSTLNIVWNELKYKCQVIKEYGDLPPVFCLISQLNQVFMNLLVNAGQAIESQGSITIRTGRCGDDGVFVEISDTGKGIPPEHLNRIFEPFFTTKPIGKGTGLGLSLSYGIVTKHHGRIEVSSTPGQGSSFRVIVPIQPATPEDGTPPSASAA